MKLTPAEVRAMSLRSQADLDAAEALRPVLSSGNPGRFKLLTAACVNDHRLVVVYQTRIGAVYLAEGEGRGGDRRDRDSEEWLNRATTAQGRLDWVDNIEGLGLDPDSHELGSIRASCRCRSESVSLSWLRDQVRAGKRRAVYPSA